MGKQARLRALRSTIKDFAKANNKTRREVAEQAFLGGKRVTRRTDEVQQAAWYFLRKGDQ